MVFQQEKTLHSRTVTGHQEIVEVFSAEALDSCLERIDVVKVMSMSWISAGKGH